MKVSPEKLTEMANHLEVQPLGTYIVTDGYVWILIDDPVGRGWPAQDVWELVGRGYGHSHSEMAWILEENIEKDLPWGLY